MPDVTAESSAANEIPAGTPEPHETWTDDQRSEWLRTGEAPKPESKTEESTTSAATEAPKPKVETAPAPEPEPKQEQEPQFKAAEARKAELNREIRELIALRSREEKALEAVRKPAEHNEPVSEDPEPLTTAYATGPDGSMTVDDLQKFQRAHSQWAIRQDRKAEAQARSEQSHKERLDAARSAHEDFDEVIEEAGNRLRFDSTPAGPAMHQAIKESDVPMELLYHLCKNPSEFRMIAALPPRKAFKAIVDLEESLTAPQAKKEEPPATPAPRKQTQAPTPITELTARHTAPVDEVAQAVRDDDFTRFKNLEDARELKKLRRA